MTGAAAEIAQRLARNAEAVCRHYLSNGRREGHYWLVGDVDNTPGRSLYVRLTGPDAGKGRAGKWTDAATGEHGDLLDLIAACRRYPSVRETLDEARAFLSLPRAEHPPSKARDRARRGSCEAARRLWAISRPIPGTLAETYLRRRGIDGISCGSLRFHPRCWYRGDRREPRDRLRDAWPAMIAAVRDDAGALTGVHRTWLDLDGRNKAPVSTPRRAIGHLLGNAVRFSPAARGQADVLAAGEGIETVLSLRQALPRLPAVAGLSANHLAAITLEPRIRRLYCLRDRDPAGESAVARLAERAQAKGIDVVVLDSIGGDLNDDLVTFGIEAVRERLRPLFAADDVTRFLASG